MIERNNLLSFLSRELDDHILKIIELSYTPNANYPSSMYYMQSQIFPNIVPTLADMVGLDAQETQEIIKESIRRLGEEAERNCVLVKVAQDFLLSRKLQFETEIQEEDDVLLLPGP
tara:strand:+ start:9110 stop:9457 length:348 start_codon:yes stop_codon:yes gene_type:complete